MQETTVRFKKIVNENNLKTFIQLFHTRRNSLCSEFYKELHFRIFILEININLRAF